MQTFTLWINAHLTKRGLSITDLEKDLSDGVMLRVLMEIILDKSLGKIHRTNNIMHKRDNLNVALNAMWGYGSLRAFACSPDGMWREAAGAAC